MDNDKSTVSSPFLDAEKLPAEVALEHPTPLAQVDRAMASWDELDADNKTQKEGILQEHFHKALERFNAGVSLAKIRKHYERLGAKYSAATFRRKWNDLLKTHAERIQ